MSKSETGAVWKIEFCLAFDFFWISDFELVILFVLAFLASLGVIIIDSIIEVF